jgi:hypothetical protein
LFPPPTGDGKVYAACESAIFFMAIVKAAAPRVFARTGPGVPACPQQRKKVRGPTGEHALHRKRRFDESLTMALPMSMPNRIKAFLTNPLCWGYAQSSFRRNPLRHLKPALWAPKVPRPGNHRWSLLACSSPSKWLTPSGIQARLWRVGIEKYVTDEALTAQAVETPCTPLAAAFPTVDLASCFCSRCD